MKTPLKLEQLCYVLFALGCSVASAQVYDFGDLSDSPYPTKLPNGARHVVTQSLYIGTHPPDHEADGPALASAQGDDTDGFDDEDGIDPATVRITAGVRYNFRVKATNTQAGNAWLHGFVDWNQDGDFLDAEEYAKVEVPGNSLAATFKLTYEVPTTAITGAQTAMRLRISTATVLDAFGPTQNGEVEDVLIPVHAPGELKDFGDLPASGRASPQEIFTRPLHQIIKPYCGRGQSLDFNIGVDVRAVDGRDAAWPDRQGFSIRERFITSWRVATEGSGFSQGRKITNRFCTGWSGFAKATAGGCMRGC